MAGVKGRSGGKREGAGRPRKPPADATEMRGFDDPLAFLRSVWTGKIDASPDQVRAAIAALPYSHRKLGEGGKKDQKQEAAQKVAGRFAAAAPPKLVVAGGKRV